MTIFQLGDEVWRVQGKLGTERSLFVFGPASVTAIIERKDSRTYFLTWFIGHTNEVECTDEQEGKCLYLSQISAQETADREHNDHCDKKKR